MVLFLRLWRSTNAYERSLAFFFFFSSRRRHTRYWRDWSSDVLFRSAHGGPLALPAVAPGLAPVDVLVVDVPDLSHGGAARQGDAAHLAGGQAQHGVRAVLCDELDAQIGRASCRERTKF